jgi:hypothetical protein
MGPGGIVELLEATVRDRWTRSSPSIRWRRSILPFRRGRRERSVRRRRSQALADNLFSNTVWHG